MGGEGVGGGERIGEALECQRGQRRGEYFRLSLRDAYNVKPYGNLTIDSAQTRSGVPQCLFL